MTRESKIKPARVVFFVRQQDGCEVRVTLPGDCHTIDEMKEAFKDFLRGAGYYWDTEEGDGIEFD